MQTLTRSLVAPAAAGVVAFAGGVAYGTSDSVFCPLYAVFILLWITHFCKRWRREEARLAFRWNVEDFEATERERREFEGEPARGFYTREGHFVDVPKEDRLLAAAPIAKRFTPEQRERRVLLSHAVVLLVVLAPLRRRRRARVPLLPAARLLHGAARGRRRAARRLPDEAQRGAVRDGDDHVTLPSSYAVTLGSVAGGVASAAFIAATNALYARLARQLTAWENHRTQTAHDDALILKTFCFQFVNSYVPLFYVGFVKAAQLDVLGGAGLSKSEYCHDAAHYDASPEAIRRAHGGLNPYCMDELSTLLTSLVLASYIIARLTETLADLQAPLAAAAAAAAAPAAAAASAIAAA